MDLKNRLVLVTGSTAGIGRQTALELANMGAHVIVHGRDPAKTQGVATELKNKSANPDVDFLVADLSSLKAVRGLAAEVKQRYGKLDVLINNAGGMNVRREVTIDGYERTFAVNHLAPFLLTNLLLPELANGKRARVVNVASAAHRRSPIDFNDLMSARGYLPMRVYGRSKGANILFTRELARRMQGTSLTTNCLHPGFVASDFLSKGGVWSVIKPIAYLFAIDEVEGARTSVYLASSDEVEGVSGRYFDKCKPTEPKPWVKDEQAQKRLWEVSEQLTGLKTESKAA